MKNNSKQLNQKFFINKKGTTLKNKYILLPTLQNNNCQYLEKHDSCEDGQHLCHVSIYSTK